MDITATFPGDSEADKEITEQVPSAQGMSCKS